MDEQNTTESEQTKKMARDDETLAEHIEKTSNFTKNFASAFGCAMAAYTTGLLHDLGKYPEAFQDYLKRSLRGEKVTRGEVIHALQGAKLISETIKESLISDIIGNIIATHHNGLFDTITDGERTLSIKINNPKNELHYKEAVEEFSKEFSTSINESVLKEEILNICRVSHEKKLNVLFMLHLMTKALYSCLIDADRCDAAGIIPDDTVPDWGKRLRQLENHLDGSITTSALNHIRGRISEQCRQAGGRQPGIYTLSVPTGGGKTLSSLRFALEHAQKHGLKRIIYVIPYLSILDQTASEMHKIFKDKNGDLILEHHSNIELPEDKDDDEEQYRLLTSRWDSPIILTTMVQFLESIYSNKASKLRKFHNMSEAVLIFDEIQSLPIKCIHLFNGAINFLHTFGQSSVLLCTATQPHLHKTERPILLSDKPDIVSLTPKEMTLFDRVRIQDETQSAMDHEQIASLAKTQIQANKSTLVILNTKDDARKVFDLCKDSVVCEKIFLTTDLCPAHRLTVLGRLRNNLNPKSRLLTLCVSTQLIEAGVDVSFECVIRAEAGMDSIIQAAGRCNRNGENPTPAPVFVVDVKNEELSRLLDIEEGKKQTARIFRENTGKNLLDQEAMNLFYKYYFCAQKNKMDYPIQNKRTTIYNLLNDNTLGQAAYKGRKGGSDVVYGGLPAAFETAAEEFSVIDGGQIGIVVPYGDALEHVVAFQQCYDPKEKMHILKQLQRYTISVFPHTVEALGKALSIVDNMFYLLSQDYYDTKYYGLLLKPDQKTLNY